MARRPILIYLIFIVILSFSNTLQARTRIQTTQKTIVLDAGHGGQDTGLVSPFGITEKEITLQLAKQIAKQLDAQYNIILTRTEDTPLLPEERAGIANQAGADLYISIHLNNARDSKAFGYYFTPPDPDHPQPRTNDTRWKMLAIKHQKQSKAACSSFAQTFAHRKPSIPFFLLGAPIRLLEGTTMPAVLIETAPVLSIPQQPTARKAWLADYTAVIIRGIHLYFNKNQADP